MSKVSVCVMTYNQEKYIGPCLESLVTQETDFDFEIIVGDDFYTDGTRDVIQEYQKKFPDIIKPVF
ncbi:glycosyltransferase family 2 protein, partial [Francisella tularensis]|uniref:glycosyltransferase family 2 protein n=1 Tax=Francisella tularensis TaxID=263 RepID=UPI002381C059